MAVAWLSLQQFIDANREGHMYCLMDEPFPINLCREHLLDFLTAMEKAKLLTFLGMGPNVRDNVQPNPWKAGWKW